MMEGLRSWARDIVFILIFAGILELLLPSGSTRKYVRVVMGLLIILVILNPVILLMRDAISPLAMDAFHYPETEAPPDLPSQTEGAVAMAFARELEAEIESAAKAMGASEARASVEVGRDDEGRWDIVSVAVEVRGAFGWGIMPVGEDDLRLYEAQAKEGLAKALQDGYGIRPEKISVTFIAE